MPAQKQWRRVALAMLSLSSSSGFSRQEGRDAAIVVEGPSATHLFAFLVERACCPALSRIPPHDSSTSPAQVLRQHPSRPWELGDPLPSHRIASLSSRRL